MIRLLSTIETDIALETRKLITPSLKVNKDARKKLEELYAEREAYFTQEQKENIKSKLRLSDEELRAEGT